MAEKPVPTLAQMLEAIDGAIVAVAAGGQSYKLGSRSLTRANLTELANLRESLAAEAAAEEEESLFRDTYVAFFEGPR